MKSTSLLHLKKYAPLKTYNKYSSLSKLIEQIPKLKLKANLFFAGRKIRNRLPV